MIRALPVLVIMLPIAVRAANTLTFSADGEHAMQFVLQKARDAAPDAPWESVRSQPVDLKTRRGDPAKASEYFFNPKLEEQTFATMDDLGRWQEILARKFHRDPLSVGLRLEVREDGDSFRFFLNGQYVNSLARNGRSANQLNFRSDRDFPLSVEYLFTQADARFETVDLTERANAAGMPGRKLDAGAAGVMKTVDGIPFLLSRNPRLDNVDLSMSWNPAAFRTGYSACHAHQRWTSPFVRMPMRYQFAVPGGDYDALYVLCATDGTRKNALPRFSVQFYRWRRSYAGSGRPFTFASEAVPIATDGKLAVVKIPLSGDLVTEFGPEKFMNFELTKDVFGYRTYADPLNHSWHGGGLPSAVRVYGVTLSKAPVTCRFDPLEKANLFSEEEDLGYRVTLANTTAAQRTEHLALSSADWYGTDHPSAAADVTLAPGETKAVTLRLDAKRYGWYAATLAGAGRTWHHSFVRLRKRDYEARPFEEKGIRAGTWTMFDSPLHAYIAGKGGWDTSSKGVLPPEAEKNPALKAEFFGILRRYGMRSFHAPSNIRAQHGIEADTPLEEGCEIYRRKLPDPAMTPENEFFRHDCTRALGEPGGICTGNAEFPEYYGEPENAYDYRKLTGMAKTRFLTYKRQIQVAHKVLREMYPKAKLMIPHGSWNFMVPFLQDPETRELSDGVQMDFQYYTRLPEQQLHQSSLNSVMIFRDAWRKYRPDSEPFLLWGEGPDVTQVYVGGSSQLGAASHRVRISMLMAAYGCNIQASWGTSVISHGENHCAGGLVTGNNALDPDLHYAAFSAWLRHVRHATHESFTFPGSTSAFVQNFRDHRTGELFRGVWTIRGERDFIFDCAPEKLTVYDPMDNLIPAKSLNGRAVVRAGEMPFFVYGAEGIAVSLGTPDHSDACQPQLGRDFYRDPFVVRLGELGALDLAQTEDADIPYVEMMPDYIRRFQATMEVASVDSEKGRALSVGLPSQPVDRMTMPYFTCLRFRKPIAIPGRAQALRLDVKAASDWGRVVYVLRDAAGRRWYSCGFKGQWNADDMEGESVFCFDGWRTLRFELPYNEPWDGFRNVGFTNWGSDDLKAKVVLPVALEKLFVERRSGVIYGCEFRRFEKDTPVLLGTLSAEYASESDCDPAAYRNQNVSSPKVPESALPNPIADLEQRGTLSAGRIVSVRDPDTWFDGTRGVFSFEMPTNAVSADVWMSRYPDGRGALRLGRNLKSSPAPVQGFLAETEFHAFLVWRDREGNVSKPSAPFRFRLEDHFGHQ